MFFPVSPLPVSDLIKQLYKILNNIYKNDNIFICYIHEYNLYNILIPAVTAVFIN